MYKGQTEYVPYKQGTKRSLNDHRTHLTSHVTDSLSFVSWVKTVSISAWCSTKTAANGRGRGHKPKGLGGGYIDTFTYIKAQAIFGGSHFWISIFLGLWKNVHFWGVGCNEIVDIGGGGGASQNWTIFGSYFYTFYDFLLRARYSIGIFWRVANIQLFWVYAWYFWYFSFFFFLGGGGG